MKYFFIACDSLEDSTKMLILYHSYERESPVGYNGRSVAGTPAASPPCSRNQDGDSRSFLWRVLLSEVPFAEAHVSTPRYCWTKRESRHELEWSAGLGYS
jgi:hypothetical protein